MSLKKTIYSKSSVKNCSYSPPAGTSVAARQPQYEVAAQKVKATQVNYLNL